MKRDLGYPNPSSPAVAKSMRGNVAKNTRPEVALRRLLREAGCGGYRLHWNVSGKPDIAYPGRRLAVFMHGCYWHRCPHCQLPVPKSNVQYWTDKFARNQARDERVRHELEAQGWTVLIVWECDIKRDSAAVVRRIVSARNGRGGLGSDGA